MGVVHGHGLPEVHAWPSRQRLTYYCWETGLTRFSNERLGYTLDGRGYYGTAYVGLNPTNDTRYAISQYDLMLGPVYRFYLQPKYAICGRVLGGAVRQLQGDTNGFKNLCFTGQQLSSLPHRHHLRRQRQRYRRIQPDAQCQFQARARVFLYRLRIDATGQSRLHGRDDLPLRKAIDPISNRMRNDKPLLVIRAGAL